MLGVDCSEGGFLPGPACVASGPPQPTQAAPRLPWGLSEALVEPSRLPGGGWPRWSCPAGLGARDPFYRNGLACL